MNAVGLDDHIYEVNLGPLPKGQTRVSQTIIGQAAGVESCDLRCIRTAPGSGSPEGLHSHLGDQIFYIVSGQMTVEMGNGTRTIGPGTVVVFPAGVPHRNWNGGSEVVVHLAINAPPISAVSSGGKEGLPG